MPRKATLSVLGLYQARNDLFDEMIIPEGMDKDIIINNILMECAELESLFPNPSFMKTAIGLWSKKEMYTWNRIWTASQIEYNPLWNKDGTYKEVRNLQSKGNTDSTEQVSAFNETTFQNRSKVTNNASGSDTGSITRTETGNIGVTTSQQMLREEYEVSEMNPYSYIVDSFKSRFCLLVY